MDPDAATLVLPKQSFLRCLLSTTILSVVACSIFAQRIQAQTGTISGVVKSADDGIAVGGASVWVAGTRLSTITSADGAFTMAAVPAGPHFVKVTLTGYAEATVDVVVQSGVESTLEISLTTRPVPLDAIAVSGSLRLQKVTDAPVSLSLVTAQELTRSNSLTYGESLQKTRGVDSYRGGADNVVLNARGFTTAFNYRFRLMVDNRSGMWPAGGIPAGAFYPVAREDIDRMEAVLGPSSALYGPNAHNGLLHIITKSPWDHPGTTWVLGGGSNSILSGRFRHADAFDRFAYKINAEYMTGKDWVKNDTVAIDNAGRVYMEDMDNSIESLRTTGSLHYSPSADVEIIASAGYAGGSSTMTNNLGRLQAAGMSFDFQQLRLQSRRFFAQVYRNATHQGDLHTVENKVAALVSAANTGSPITVEEAKDLARMIGDDYRLSYEAQYRDRFSLGGTGLGLIAGAQHEDTRPNSGGTVYTEGRVNIKDPVTGTLSLRQTGVYGQAEVDFDNRWRLVLAGRYDAHSKYESRFSPRAAIVYRIPDKGSFRFTYNRAFQAPEIIQLALLFSGGMLPGTSIPIVARGNGDGFTLSDGTVIQPLTPENNTTFEVGYKGQLGPEVYLDVSLYRSRYESFQSALTPITDPANGVSPVKWGDKALEPFPSQFVVTFRNFGRVHVSGVDVGLRYRLNDRVDGWLNYSHMDPSGLDEPENDFNADGYFEELSFNSPANKASFGVSVRELLTPGLGGSFSGRWIEEYDFISGVHRATRARRIPGSFQFKDRGPLGGFTTFDLNLSYAVNTRLQVNFSATNLFDSGLRETVGSPAVRRLVLTELKYRTR